MPASSEPDYRLHRPAPPLAGLVDYLWSLHDSPAHSFERIFPCGTLELVINLHEDEFRIEAGSGAHAARYRGAMVSGAYSRSFVAETRAHTSILGVHFKPGGATAVLGISAGELADAHVELDALWGRRATLLRERLCEASQPSARFRILEQALLGQLADAAVIRPEIRHALDRLCQPEIEVAAVARELEWSHRRFIALFTEQVGMTPKRFARVARFQRALALSQECPALAWTQVALDCGFFDQSHLCHDWLEFTGFSPVEFVRQRAVRVKEHHVALPELTQSKFSNTAAPRRA